MTGRSSLTRELTFELPTLIALGCQVGCGPFYRSRIFSQRVGKTICRTAAVPGLHVLPIARPKR